jgi:hypothetical protein
MPFEFKLTPSVRSKRFAKSRYILGYRCANSGSNAQKRQDPASDGLHEEFFYLCVPGHSSSFPQIHGNVGRASLR